jgi:hypothetical protein
MQMLFSFFVQGYSCRPPFADENSSKKTMPYAWDRKLGMALFGADDAHAFTRNGIAVRLRRFAVGNTRQLGVPSAML